MPNETTPPPSSRITPAAWKMLFLVSLTQMLSLLDRNILAILNPRIKADLNIGDAEMGLLYGTVFALFYVLFSLPIGRLADGWIRTRLLSISIAFWSFSTGLAAFAGGFALLAVSRLGVGIGEAAAQPAGTSLICDHFPKARRGMAMAVIAAAIAVGLGLSSILGGLAADWWDSRYAGGHAPLGFSGWQFAFIVAALPGFPLAIAMWYAREPKRGLMDGIITKPDPAPFRASAEVFGSVLPLCNWFLLWRKDAGARQWAINIGAMLLIISLMAVITYLCSSFSPRPSLHLGGIAFNPHVLQWSVIGIGLLVIVNLIQSLRINDPAAYAVIFGSPALMICIVAGALQTLINYGVMGFTPLFLMKNYGLTPGETGLQFGLLAAAIGVLGPAIAGPITDMAQNRFGGKGRVAVLFLSLTLSPLLLTWVFSAPSASAFYWRFIFYSVLLTMWLPPIYAIMYDQVLPRIRATTASIYMFVTTILGLGIGPYAVGIISDANGGNTAAAIGTINMVAPIIIILLVILFFRVEKDEKSLLSRARAASEPV
ncbi:MAG: MFS transporter [Sphingobium sp.]|nr:MFS transporter [Sphingobium sp.]